MSKVLKQWDQLYEHFGKLKKNPNSKDVALKVLETSNSCLRILRKNQDVNIEALVEAFFVILENPKLDEFHDRTYKMLVRQRLWDEPTTIPAFHAGVAKIQPSWTDTDSKIIVLLTKLSALSSPSIEWYRLMILLTTHENRKIHNDAYVALTNAQQLERKPSGSLMKHTSTMLQKRLAHLLQNDDSTALKEILEENIPIYLTVMQPSMTQDSVFLNKLLQIIKQGFEHDDQNLRISAFISWGKFIVLLQHFGTKEVEKRIDLIVKPMKKTLKSAAVIESSLVAFWPLIKFLDKKILNEVFLKKVLTPLVKICIDPASASPSSSSSSSGKGKKSFKLKRAMEERLNAIASEVFAHITVSADKISNYFADQLLEPLTSPIIELDNFNDVALSTLLPLFTQVFVQSIHCSKGHSEILLDMWELCTMKVCHNLAQTAGGPTAQDGVLFRKLLETIDTISEMDHRLVSPSFLFKLITFFTSCPGKILNSSKYNHVKGETLSLRTTPIMHLLSILLSKHIVHHDAPGFHHLWMDLVQHWIDCGMTGCGDNMVDFARQVLLMMSSRDHFKYLLVWTNLANRIIENSTHKRFTPSPPNSQDDDDDEYYRFFSQMFAFPLLLPTRLIIPSPASSPSSSDDEQEDDYHHSTSVANCQQCYVKLYTDVTSMMSTGDVIKLQTELLSNGSLKAAMKDATDDDGTFAYYLSLYRPIVNGIQLHQLVDKRNKQMLKVLNKSIFSPQDGDDRFFQIGMFCLYELAMKIDCKEELVLFLTKFHQQILRGSKEKFMGGLEENGCGGLHAILRSKTAEYDVQLKNVKLRGKIEKESWENCLTCIKYHLIKYPADEKEELQAEINNTSKSEYSELMQTQDTEQSAGADEANHIELKKMEKLNSSVTKRRKRKLKALPPPSPPQQLPVEEDDVIVAEHNDDITVSPATSEKDDVTVSPATSEKDDVTVSPATAENDDVAVANNDDVTVSAAAEKDDVEVAATAVNDDVTPVEIDDATRPPAAAVMDDVQMSPVLNITKRRKRKSTRSSRATNARKRRLVKSTDPSTESEAAEKEPSTETSSQVAETSGATETAATTSESTELADETSGAAELSTEAPSEVPESAETEPVAETSWAADVLEEVEESSESLPEAVGATNAAIEATEVEPESVESSAEVSAPPQSPPSSPGVELPSPPTPDGEDDLPVVVVVSDASDDDMPLSKLNHNNNNSNKVNNKKRPQKQASKKTKRRKFIVTISDDDDEDIDKSLSQVLHEIKSASPPVRPCVASNLDENLDVDDAEKEEERQSPVPGCNLDISLDEEELEALRKVSDDFDATQELEQELEEETQDLEKDDADATQEVDEDLNATQALEKEDAEETQGVEQDVDATQEEDVDATQEEKEDLEATQDFPKVFHADFEEDPGATQVLEKDDDCSVDYPVVIFTCLDDDDDEVKDQVIGETEEQENDVDVSMDAQIDSDEFDVDVATEEGEMVETCVENDKKADSKKEAKLVESNTSILIDLTGDDMFVTFVETENGLEVPTEQVDTCGADLDISDIPTEEETGMETSVATYPEEEEEKVVSTKEVKYTEAVPSKVSHALNSTFNVPMDNDENKVADVDTISVDQVQVKEKLSSFVEQTADVSTGDQTTDTRADPVLDLDSTADRVQVKKSSYADQAEVKEDPSSFVDQTTDLDTTGDQTTDVDTTGDQTTGVDTTGDQTTDVDTTGDQTTDTSVDLIIDLDNTADRVQVKESSSADQAADVDATADQTKDAAKDEVASSAVMELPKTTTTTSSASVTSQLTTDQCSSPISNKSTNLLLHPLHSSPVVTGIPMMRSCSLTYPKKSVLKRSNLFSEKDSPSPKKTKGVTFNSSFDHTKEYVRHNSDTPMRPTSSAVIRKRNSPSSRSNGRSSTSRELVFASRGEQMLGKALASSKRTTGGGEQTAGKRMVAAAQAAQSEGKRRDLLQTMNKTRELRAQLRSTFDAKNLESMSVNDLAQILLVIHPNCAVALALNKKLSKNLSSSSS